MRTVPFNYTYGGDSWALYQVHGPKSKEFHDSLKDDAVPAGAPLNFDPKDPPADHDKSKPITERIRHFFTGQTG